MLHLYIHFNYSIVNIVSKSPTGTSSHGSDRASYISSQGEFELSEHQTPRSHVDMLTARSLPSRSQEASSYKAFTSSVYVVIPRSPVTNTAATSTQFRNQNNNSTNAVTEHHHSSVCSPALTPSKPGESPPDIGDFTTNEKQLQLYLKQNGFPYRVMRRNVETDLEAGLQSYFELDVLDESNKFMCDNCTARRMEKRGIGF